ncbi:MAG: type II toxin-antitoxin system HicB family antitoxin [Candidatus Bathyarchaeia archaeon]|jgi:predicted RNase H-like HicB family nuclease
MPLINVQPLYERLLVIFHLAPSGWKSESFIGKGHNHQGRMQMASVRYTAVLESAEEGGFVIKCVELPVATEGETKEEALANLREAIESYLEVKAERLREQTKGERVEVIVEAPSALMA